MLQGSTVKKLKAQRQLMAAHGAGAPRLPALFSRPRRLLRMPSRGLRARWGCCPPRLQPPPPPAAPITWTSHCLPTFLLSPQKTWFYFYIVAIFIFTEEKTSVKSSLHLKSFNMANETPPHTTILRYCADKTDVVHRAEAHLVSSVFSSEHLKKSRSPYFIKGTHSCYWANVVGDGDQRCSGEVLFTDSLSLLLAYHVSKAVKEEKKHAATEPKGNTAQRNLNVTLLR